MAWAPFFPITRRPLPERRREAWDFTLYLLGLVRLLLPSVLLPATTALGTVFDGGRELGILCGANVVMPNLSPAAVRGNYLLYDNKLCTGCEASEGLSALRKSMESIGYEIVAERGDCAGYVRP